MSLKYGERNITDIFVGDQRIIKRIQDGKVLYERNTYDPRFRFYNPGDTDNELYFEQLRSGSALAYVKLSTSTDGVNWTPESYIGHERITLKPKQTLYMRGKNSFASGNSNAVFRSTKPIECHGEISDILDNSAENVEVFNGMTTLLTAPNLPSILTRTFGSLFWGCTSLIEPPELPATTLIPSCYEAMFYNCTSLVEPPSLPANILTDNCYKRLCEGCISLKEISNLSHVKAANASYSEAFKKVGVERLNINIDIDYDSEVWSAYYSMLTYCENLREITVRVNVINNTIPVTETMRGFVSYCPNLEKLTLEINGDVHINYFAYKCPKLNDVTIIGPRWVDQEFGKYNTCLSKYWMSNGAASGVFHKDSRIKIGTGKYDIKEDTTDGIPTGWTIIDIDSPITPESFRLYNTSDQENTISITKTAPEAPTIKYKYSIDEGETWNQTVDSSTTPIQIKVPAKTNLYLRGDNPQLSNSYTKTVEGVEKTYIGANKFSSTLDVEAHGNITDLVGVKSTYPDYCFALLFEGMNTLKTVPTLNITNLSAHIYDSMFADTYVSILPENLLPATTLAPYCYNNMFYWAAIKQLPVKLLPATTLAEGCYSYMFQSNPILEIPSGFLPATILAKSCYGSLFSDCDSLTTAPKDLLPCMDVPQWAYSFMFNGCTSLTQAPDLPAPKTTGGPYQNMFTGCSSLEIGPKIMTKTQSYHNFNHIFSGCSKLREIEIHVEGVWDSKYSPGFTEGVAANGVFKNLGGATNIPIGSDGIPTGWTIQDI